jgi:hypothetical protein
VIQSAAEAPAYTYSERGLPRGKTRDQVAANPKRFVLDVEATKDRCVRAFDLVTTGRVSVHDEVMHVPRKSRIVGRYAPVRNLEEDTKTTG